MIKLLLVEDDVNLSYMIKGGLEDMIGGYEVAHALNGEDGVKAWKQFQPDIIVSDVEMPVMDGFSMVKLIREKDNDIPIVFATAKKSPKDVTIGYSLGVDNYIKKPFLPEELDAHIQAVLRLQNKRRTHETIYILGKFRFDPKHLNLSDASSKRDLTTRETQILQMLCENKGEIVPRGEILNRLWKTNDFYSSRSLDVFVKKLRNYLAADSSIEIQTVKGIGLRLIVPV